MRRLSFLSLCLLLALTACSAQPVQGDYQLYFPSASYVDGPALGCEPISLGDGALPVEALVSALLSGPQDTDLYSPFPRGVALRSWYVKDGLLHINLSEQYGGLSGISLTLADYSIALTLCQLPGVSGVSITVENDPIPFRYRQILSTDDVLLTDLPGDAGE